MSAKGLEQRAGAGVPDLRRAAKTRGRQPPSVVAEYDCADPVVEVGADGSEEMASLRIPDPEDPLHSPRRYEPAIGGKRHARCHAFVSCEPANLAAVGRVPDDRARVFAAGQELPAVGAE